MKQIQDKIRIFMSVGFVLFLALTMQAQTTVSGVVTDATNGEPLIGASVLVSGTSDGTTTDVDGSFSVTTRQATPFTLEISYTGYAGQSIEISGSRSDLAIAMDESATLIDEVVISASRKREKVQEAPAAISVLGARQLEGSPQTNAVRNLVTTPGVQIMQQSAARMNISIRGGAGLFGTAAFPIQDYRSLVGPGIGTFDVLNSPIVGIDLDRIEVVRGPGSALYGPGVTTGVIHFITKSAIDKPGTTIELYGGELASFGAAVRHAGRNDDKTFGYKINARYQRGDEFTLDNDEDADQIAKFQDQIIFPAVSGGIVDATIPGEVVLTRDDLDPDGDGNMMQDDYFATSVSGTLEFRPQNDLSIIATGGWNTASAVFYNSQGEGLSQASEYYGQVRVQKGGLFAQMFYVDNNGGTRDKPSFLYQTGNVTGIARKQLEGQVQYNFGLKGFLDSDWVAGIDYRQSVSDSENTVYGRNEDDDDYSIIGGYIQGKLKLASKLDLVLAGRYDQFNFLDDGAFAPRAAIVFKASPAHTFRASYNRASAPSSTLTVNIDFPLATIIPGAYDIWLVGNKEEQTFNNPEIVFPAGLGLPSLPIGTPGMPLAYGFLAVNDAVIPGLLGALEAADPNLIPLLPVIEGILRDPANIPGGVTGTFTGRNIFNGSELGLINAPQTRISTSDVWEFGYKGLIKNKLGVTVDLYHRKVQDFTLFTAISPTYSLDNPDFAGGLSAAMSTVMNEQLTAVLLSQGFPAETAAAIAGAVAAGTGQAYAAGGQGFQDALAPLLGTIATTPTDNVPQNGVTHIAAGYRTFDEIAYWGADLGLEYYFNNDLSAYFNYSWVEETTFDVNVVGAAELGTLQNNLAIPQNKWRLGVIYAPQSGIRANVSFQHDDSFFADLGQFTGDTEVRNIVDAGVGYKFDNGLAIDISGTNILNNEYRSFVNMPKIGRILIGKVTYTFGDK